MNDDDIDVDAIANRSPKRRKAGLFDPQRTGRSLDAGACALGATSNFPPGAESFATVRADLDKAHLIGDDGCLTPLADRSTGRDAALVAVLLPIGTESSAPGACSASGRARRRRS